MSIALARLSGFALRARAWGAAASFALALPVLAINSWSAAYADRLGDGIAARLVALTPALPPPPEKELWAESGDLAPPLDEPASVGGAALESKRGRKPMRPRVSPARGIRITAAQVLTLAARRTLPSAVFVKASVEHPAGLLLGGVSALGVGLQDGDILTEAAGQKATSVAQVVGIVLAARGRQASEISGRFYRQGVPFSLTVEQPYPKQPVPG